MLATLPGWFTDAAAVVGAIAVLTTFLCAVLRYIFLPHLRNFITETAKPLVDDLAEVKELVNRELRPNGGSSLRDEVACIKTDIAVLKAKH